MRYLDHEVPLMVGGSKMVDFPRSSKIAGNDLQHGLSVRDDDGGTVNGLF